MSSIGHKCGFCHRGADVESVCGHLHSEITKEGTLVVAHHRCMQYSAKLVQYKFEHFGGFKIEKVQEEMLRVRNLKCYICKGKKTKIIPKGKASAGCALKKCSRSFHYYCAKTDPDIVTKRLVVSFKNADKKTILYRVFCCNDHESEYRKNLKSYLLAGNNENTSDISEDEDDDGVYNLGSSLLSQDPENTSFVQLTDLDTIPDKKRLGSSKKKSARKSAVSKTGVMTSPRLSANTAGNSHVRNEEEHNSEEELISNSNLKNNMVLKIKDIKTPTKSPPKGFNTTMNSNDSAKSPKSKHDTSPSAKLPLSPKSQNDKSSKLNGASPSKLSLTSPKSSHDKNSKSSSNSKTSPGNSKTSPGNSKTSPGNSKTSPGMPSSNLKHLGSARKRRISDSDSSEEDFMVKRKQHCVTLRSRSKPLLIDDDETVEMIPSDDDRTSNDDIEDDNMKGSSNFTIKRECVLCIPALSTLSHETREHIVKEISEESGSNVNIMMWHDLHPGVAHSETDLVFLVMDLAKCVEGKKTEELKHFLLSSEYFKHKVDTEYKFNSKMLDDLEDPEMVKQILEKTWKKVSHIFSNVLENTGYSIGRVVSVARCKVLKLNITDTLDEDGSIRALWPDTECLTLWDDNTKLSREKFSRIDAAESVRFAEREENILEIMLTEACLLSSIAIYPQEKILKSSAPSTNLVKHLKKEMHTVHAAVGTTTSQTQENIWKTSEQSSNLVENLRKKSIKMDTVGTSLLVFERVDTEVVNFENYLRKVLKSKDCTQLSNLVIVLQTSLMKSKANRASVVSLLPGDMQSEVKVFTVVDPASMPCSWIVLQISSTAKDDDDDENEQMASMSRQSRKRVKP